MKAVNDKNNISITLKNKEKNKVKRFRRGDVVRVDLGKATGDSMAGVRLAIIVSNEGINAKGGFVLVVPITNAEHKRVNGVIQTMRGQYYLDKNKYTGLKYNSVVQTVDIRPYPVEKIKYKYEHINRQDMIAISKELQYTLGMLKQ